MNLEFVRELIEAVDGSGIDTLEITRSGTRIRISKSPTQVLAPLGAAAAGGPASVTTANATTGAPVEGAAPATDRVPEKAGPELSEVKSPMVGTFYRAPAPEAPPYVETGSIVSKGQTLCVLEAMKLMNELECEVDGVVREILVENADPVEYGQVLFRIEPTGSA
ncbi:MAG TPA: acetyl-CoA carboxylase biotin carboxyl carrier protein [Longimicrobiales bacterium]|nr:acetyl-CoA carboxylase biotin carboxyl carrier protein [Longimicrobiales bacterium]